jgi:hypothetical protein
MRWSRGRALLGAVLSIVILFYPLLAPTPHRIDSAHFARVQEGMTEAEVEAIFGVPAGAYGWAVPDDDSRYSFQMAILDALLVARLEEVRVDGGEATQRGVQFLRSVWPTTTRTWTSRSGSITIGFNDDGRICMRGSWQTTHLEPPWQRWWQKLRH